MMITYTLCHLDKNALSYGSVFVSSDNSWFWGARKQDGAADGQL